MSAAFRMITAPAAVGPPPQGGRGAADSELVHQGDRQDPRGNFTGAREAFQKAIDAANAFSQQGEMANETAHICIDVYRPEEIQAKDAAQFAKAATVGGHNPPAAFARRLPRSKG